MKKHLTLISLLIFMACGSPTANETAETYSEVETKTSHHIPAIRQVFDAHGGYENWMALKSLSYENGGGTTLVDLQHRYTLIEGEEQTVGFDGQNVWVNPPSDQADRQRMRYNLMFYFYAFPLVIGDPGVNYQVLDPVALDGKTFDAVKISYDNGVGDSPKDNYIVLSNQENHQMEWLMYTATFGAEVGKDTYSLIKYEGWKEIEGVILPSSLQWYQYEDERLGESRGDARTFSNISVSKMHPPVSKFNAPEGAYIIEN